MMQPLIRLLAGIPFVFDLLRWILEGGFAGHRSVFTRELESVLNGKQSPDSKQGTCTRRILDLGCGTGQHADRFRSDEYLGIDLSRTYLEAARGSYPDRQWCQADAGELPLRSFSMDAIVISGLLHHMDDHAAGRTLDEASRVLKQDGTLVIWEDIPTEIRWNVPGRLAHRLDLGKHIRPSIGYRLLLEQKFLVISERKMRSGFMDYAVFVCKPRLTDCPATVNCGTFRENPGN